MMTADQKHIFFTAEQVTKTSRHLQRILVSIPCSSNDRFGDSTLSLSSILVQMKINFLFIDLILTASCTS